MPMTYRSARWDRLPWPSGLGKHGSRYSNLEHELRACQMVCVGAA
jgi:hypothetical protein